MNQDSSHNKNQLQYIKDKTPFISYHNVMKKSLGNNNLKSNLYNATYIPC